MTEPVHWDDGREKDDETNERRVDDPEPEDDGDDFASGFASQGSSRPAGQEAQVEAKILRIGPAEDDEEGRSPVSTLPLIIRDLAPESDRRPTPTQTSRILRSLTQRDLLILQFLYDYRYLDTLQIRQLFFPSLRSAQMRLQILENLHLIYRWKVIQTPGVLRRPSLILISPRGARVVAGFRGDDEKYAAEDAREVRDHCWHAIHDLEANGFFVALAAASGDQADVGLLMWWGEEHMRSTKRKNAVKGRSPAPTPDGGAELQTRAGQIYIELEWDRATESLRRIRGKAASYFEYYSHFGDSDRHHVLFVLPTHEREIDAREAIWHERPRYGHVKCCRFWTTTRSQVISYPLGRIWLPVDVRSQERPDRDIFARLRTAITAMEPYGENDRPFRDCIGKERWWDRRPGGGQAA